MRGDVLVMAKLDRLTRSLKDFAARLETAERQGWAIVALDLGIDMTTPAGELVASIMAAISMWERRIIGVRTRESLAEAKAKGVQLGRSRILLRPAVEQHMLDLWAAAQSLASIAEDLNGRGIPPAGRGKQWYGSTVKAVLDRLEVEA